MNNISDNISFYTFKVESTNNCPGFDAINNNIESEMSHSQEENFYDFYQKYEKPINSNNINNKGILFEKNSLINVKEKDLKKYLIESKKVKNKCGRKRNRESDNNNNQGNEHDKYSDDNVRRKIKRILLTYLLKYINNQIKIKYKGKIGKGIIKKELKIINQSLIVNSNVDYNKELLNKTLGEIFSHNLTKRYTTIPIDNNRKLIKDLMNDIDEEKRMYFQKLFNLTFIESLKHFRGEKNKILEGFESFDETTEIKNKFKRDYNDWKDYILHLKHYLDNYEKIISKKTSRMKNKQKDQKQEELTKDN
jgi:hypothetical protein